MIKSCSKFSSSTNGCFFNRNSMATGLQRSTRAEVTQRLYGRNCGLRCRHHASPQNSSHFSADDFADFFTSKVDKSRASTSSAPPPVIKKQPVATPFSSFEPVSVNEVTQLLSRTPAKHCLLDPVPTWLVKRASDVLASMLSKICNASLQSGDLPDTQKSALVFLHLKKPTMNAEDTNSYRPISI